jgi:hypothetical protein
LLADSSIVRLKLSQLQLRRPRQWGASWLALMLMRELQLDQFWSKRLGVSRKRTHWAEVLFVLAAYPLLAPGSEWRLHREWFRRGALSDLLGEDAGLAEIHRAIRQGTPHLPDGRTAVCRPKRCWPRCPPPTRRCIIWLARRRVG